MEVKEHIFEKAGLGKAPYKFLGVEVKVGPIRLNDGMTTVGAPGQPMGTCAYCATGIANCYYLKSADGKQFYVGCDCILKAGDAGLRKIVNKELSKKRKEAKLQKTAELRKELALYVETHADDLKKRAHPVPTMKDKTLFDYAQYILTYGGLQGLKRLRTCF